MMTLKIQISLKIEKENAHLHTLNRQKLMKQQIKKLRKCLLKTENNALLVMKTKTFHKKETNLLQKMIMNKLFQRKMPSNHQDMEHLEVETKNLHKMLQNTDFRTVQFFFSNNSTNNK